MNRGRGLSVTRGVEFSVFRSCVAFSRAGPVFSQGQFPLGAWRGADNSYSFLSTLAEVTFLSR